MGDAVPYIPYLFNPITSFLGLGKAKECSSMLAQTGANYNLEAT